MKLNRSEQAVLAFTCVYVTGFFGYFSLAGNYEFISYVATLLVLMGLVAWVNATVRLPIVILWALSIWGLAHMAGGGIRVDGSVLYALQLIPITNYGELTLLKYDQVVHFYGFAITAWVLWHILYELFPTIRRAKSIHVFPALASMGLGALNEMIEFTAVLAFPNTNVGGYFNTALDLVFNALGAATAMVVIYLANVASRKGVTGQ